MEVLIVVLMVDLIVKGGISRFLLMHVGFFTPYVDDYYYLNGPLVLIYVDVCRGRGDVGGMVGIHGFGDVGSYIFQTVIC